jgi:hypothetical protein
MHGKSDLKLSLQKIFPPTWPSNRPDIHPALYPSALGLSENVPQIPADKPPTVFAPIIRNLAFTRSRQFVPLDSCTCQLLLSFMRQRYTVESHLSMLTLSACLLYHDGRVRPTYGVVNWSSTSSLGPRYTDALPIFRLPSI